VAEGYVYNPGRPLRFGTWDRLLAHVQTTSDAVGVAYTVSGWTATGVNGIEMNGQGDSGGPVFVPSGDRVYAVGLISGIHTGTG
jgi:hypothetical protein